MIDAVDLAKNADDRPKTRRPLTELETFFIKLAAVLIAIVIVLVVAAHLVEAKINEAAARFKGGPVFWAQVEKKLYALADEPDLPEQRKAQIIRALEKLSAKYRPYVDAVVSSARK